jgi:WD40 repeat protein
MATLRRIIIFSFLTIGLSGSLSCSMFSSLVGGSSDAIISPKNANRLKTLAKLPFIDCGGFSIDENVVAVVCGSKIHLYSLTNPGEELFELDASASVENITIDPNNQRMITFIYGADPGLELWDLTNGKKIRTFSEQIDDVKFSPDGKILATVSSDDQEAVVRLWDSSTGNPGKILKDWAGRNPDFGTTHIAFRSDGKMLAIGSGEEVYLWDMVMDEPAVILPLESDSAVLFSPNGNYLAVSAYDSIYVWDIAGGKELSFIQDAHVKGVFQVIFSPDNKLLISHGYDDTLIIWDLAQERKLDYEQLSYFPVSPESDVFFNEDGSRFYTRVHTQIRAWDTKDGRNVLDAILENSCTNGELGVLSPDYQLIVCIQYAKISLLKVADGKEVSVLAPDEHQYIVQYAQFSPDGKYLAAAFLGFAGSEKIYIFSVQ